MTVTVDHQNLVSTVTLNYPPMNLLTIEALDAIIAAHQEADNHPETRVIITRSALPGIFSNGLDPMYVLKKTPAERIAIFEAVGRTLNRMFRLGKPHIAAINGPAMAGGAILAITADFRVFDSQHGRLSFSEPKVGLPIPRSVSSVIALFCAPPLLREVVLLGKNMDAVAAKEAGLADAIAEGDGFQEAIDKLVDRMARLSPKVMRETKEGYRGHLYELTASMEHRNTGFNEFVGDSFLGEGLSALVEKRFPNFRQ